jgi:hypothetical protein
MADEEKDRKVGGVSAQARPPASASERKQSSRKIGGVSAKARPTGPELVEIGAGPLSGPAHPDFVYNGGTVITSPFIYATFWGSLWLSDPAHLTEAGRLSQFLKDLVASQYMNVLSQYGVGNGAGSGLFIQSSFVSSVPANLKDSDIHNVLQTAINGGVIPEPPKNNKSKVVVIFLDENTAVNDSGLGIVMCEPSGDNAFGYHFDFVTAAGNECYYAVIPALQDACLKNSCPSDPGCSLHLSQTQEQRRTQVTSHEFAEMCTDPKFKTGWWGPSSDENGDICNGEADNITVGPNTWDVQRQYSKTDDINSGGKTFCITTAPTPIPKLSPGPSGLTAEMASAQRIGSYETFLPLPAVHFDFTAKKATLDQTAVESYFNRFFGPLGHKAFFKDFPGMLRQVADILEKSKK